MKLFLPVLMFAAAAYAASPETLMEFQMDLRDPYNPLTLRGHPPDCGDENEGENGGPVGDNGGSPSPGQGSSDLLGSVQGGSYLNMDHLEIRWLILI
ncbi:hypothetical protein K4K48_006233 [Colletotrichum sp. SAR 10_66]|nr:hypothetical protein K4K52_007029 [Colletotrichum sp. SAR 10_76]KAJ4997857.1 hypothetical protein K4K48_006233 [Colletotrichum sp. SAR 10_66]